MSSPLISWSKHNSTNSVSSCCTLSVMSESINSTQSLKTTASRSFFVGEISSKFVLKSHQLSILICDRQLMIIIFMDNNG